MKYDVKDIELAKKGKLRIEWANEYMKVLSLIRKTAAGLDTVISVDVACRAAQDGTWPCEKILQEAGFSYRPNAKVNVGLGKPFIG